MNCQILVPRDDREVKVAEVWRGSNLAEGSIFQYMAWVRRFRKFCQARHLDEIEQCTLAGAKAFARAYRGIRVRGPLSAASQMFCRNALHAWSYALTKLGSSLPQWAATDPSNPMPPVLVEYLEFRRIHRGAAPNTIERDREVVSAFLSHLRARKKSVRRTGCGDFDSFVNRQNVRRSRSCVARDCSALRAFFRYLHMKGFIRRDLASDLVSPRVGKYESPPRVLPWNDVLRILRAVPRDKSVGRRDYAMLLLMATYGLGGAEVRGMRLEDISWKENVLRVRRPKTGVSIELPLLPTVARAIASYLRKDRSRHAAGREVFLTMHIPHGKVDRASLNQQIRRYAAAAGIKEQKLGGHLFRRSFATKQIDSGTSQKMVADIIGHRSTSSTSVYIRVALRRLREIALPVPR